MRTRFKNLIKVLLGVIFAAVIPSARLSAQTNEQAVASDIERRLATQEKRSAQETEYLNALAAAVQMEKRNDSWAAKKESEISISYEAAKDVPPGALKSVECRSSKCELQLQVSAGESPETVIKQQTAIEQWIGSQSCGYTVTHPRAAGRSQQPAPATIRIFVDCGK